MVKGAAKVQNIIAARVNLPDIEYYYHRQEECYRRAIACFSDEFEWLVFLDADELIHFRGGFDARAFLNGFGEDVWAIGVNWCPYGSNDHILTPKKILVEAYTRHGTEEQPIATHIKSFVRPEKVGPNWLNVHCFDVPLEHYAHASGFKLDGWGRSPGS